MALRLPDAASLSNQGIKGCSYHRGGWTFPREQQHRYPTRPRLQGMRYLPPTNHHPPMQQMGFADKIINLPIRPFAKTPESERSHNMLESIHGLSHTDHNIITVPSFNTATIVSLHRSLSLHVLNGCMRR